MFLCLIINNFNDKTVVDMGAAICIRLSMVWRHWCRSNWVRLLMASSSSRARCSSSEEEDVGRGSGVQPYRFEPRRRSNNGDEESDAGELTLRYEN